MYVITDSVGTDSSPPIDDKSDLEWRFVTLNHVKIL